MATVTGFTAEKMQAIIDETVSGAHIAGDDLILELTGGGTVNAGNVRGATGPTGPTGDVAEAPEDGERYERKDGLWVRTNLPHGFGFKVPNNPDQFDLASTTGEDWYAAHPLDVAFTKVLGATESNVLVHLYWSANNPAAAWAAAWAGVKVGGTDYWGTRPHQFNQPSHMEFSDKLWLTGLAAGSVTMRARMKLVPSSNTYRIDFADGFMIEYEEIPI